MLTMNHLLLFLAVFSSVALSSALKCDERYSETDAYFELKGLKNSYEFSGSVTDGMFKLTVKSQNNSLYI